MGLSRCYELCLCVAMGLSKCSELCLSVAMGLPGHLNGCFLAKSKRPNDILLPDIP